MTYGESNGHVIDDVTGHVIDDVTWPWKVKDMTEYVLGQICRKQLVVLFSNNRLLNIVRCEDVRTAILATAWLLAR